MLRCTRPPTLQMFTLVLSLVSLSVLARPFPSPSVAASSTRTLPIARNTDLHRTISLLNRLYMYMDSISQQTYNRRPYYHPGRLGKSKSMLKRIGLGIAGLDNMDIITSTLDRAKSGRRRQRVTRPRYFKYPLSIRMRQGIPGIQRLLNAGR